MENTHTALFSKKLFINTVPRAQSQSVHGGRRCSKTIGQVLPTRAHKIRIQCVDGSRCGANSNFVGIAQRFEKVGKGLSAGRPQRTQAARGSSANRWRTFLQQPAHFRQRWRVALPNP